MESDRIKILVDRYFEGETTLEEERELARYFTHDENIPEEYAAIKAIFTVTSAAQEITAPQNIKMPTAKNRRWWRITGGLSIAAAAVAAIVLLIIPSVTIEDIATQQQRLQHNPQTEMEYEIVCHIDGARVMDMNKAYNQTNKILSDVADDMQSAMAQINKINSINIK